MGEQGGRPAGDGSGASGAAPEHGDCERHERTPRVHHPACATIGSGLKSALVAALCLVFPHGDPRQACKWRSRSIAVVDLLAGAILVASLVHLFHGVTEPLSVFVRAVVLNDAGPKMLRGSHVKDREDVAVLKIDRQYFLNSPYQGISPLDRCQLDADIQSVLHGFPGLESLGIDFDLSTTDRRDQGDCQDRVLKTLSDAAQGLGRKHPIKVTIIQPVREDDRLRYAKWMASVRQSQIHLADPDIETPFGLAHGVKDRHECRALGKEVGTLPAGSASSTSRAADRCMPSTMAVSEPAKTIKRIPYQHLGALKWSPKPKGEGGIETFPEQVARMGTQAEIRYVLLGPAYDQFDEVTSPFGPLDGVDIHASFLLAAVHPEEGQSKAIEFALDVMLGMLIGGVMTWAWAQYLTIATGQHPLLSPSWGLLVLSFGAFILLAGLVALIWASSLALIHLNYWLDPTAMAVGMLIDTLVISSVHAALHELEHRGHEPERAATVETSPQPAAFSLSAASLPRLLFAQLPTAAWVGIVWAAAQMH